MTAPGVPCSLPCSQEQQGHELIGKGHNVDERTGASCLQRKVERAGTVEAEEEKTTWDLTKVHKTLEVMLQREWRLVLSSVVIRGNVHNIQHRRFSLNIRKYFFIVGMTKQRFPREVLWH